MAKLVKNQEKIQVTWGVEIFLTFLMYSTKRGMISPSQSNTCITELEKLIKEADDSTAVADQLNHYISTVNTQMKQNSDPATFAPFPSFSFIIPDQTRSAVLDHLDMVERTLTEAAEAGVIDWDKESNYFTAILKVFSQVEKGQMRPLEALAKLLSELKKINQLLSEEDKLPLLDLSAYE